MNDETPEVVVPEAYEFLNYAVRNVKELVREVIAANSEYAASLSDVQDRVLNKSYHVSVYALLPEVRRLVVEGLSDDALQVLSRAMQEGECWKYSEMRQSLLNSLEGE